MTTTAALVYLVQDLFFAAKIAETAAQAGVVATRAADPAALASAARGARLVVVDLRRPDALAALDLLAADPATRAVRSVGFVDHENVDAMKAAAAHGCGAVLSKRKFSAELPVLVAACR
jgi:CheY-like chemotaxis protein